MNSIRTVQEMQTEADTLRQAGKKIGFVPTMGYLHEGHLSLIRIARSKADVVVVSIFINPTQFGPDEDLDQYPRDFARDEHLAQESGTDIIFYPSKEEMYPHDYMTYVNVEGITNTLCGASRPTHFRGVTTICTKLFLAVKPQFTVFGQKDAQQTVVIRRMVKDLNFDMEIIVGPIIRGDDGLAMSSRNAYLSPDERQDALALHQSLKLAEDIIKKGERKSEIIIQTISKHIDSKKHTRIDYISIVQPETLTPLNEIEDRTLIALAVFLGKTRLIDNTIVEL